METESDQAAALSRHKESLGSRYVEVFLSCKADLLQAAQYNKQYQNINRRQWLGQAANLLAPRGQVPYNAGLEDLSSAFQGAPALCYCVRFAPCGSSAV